MRGESLMKKIVSISIAAAMAMAMVPSAFAKSYMANFDAGNDSRFTRATTYGGHGNSNITDRNDPEYYRDYVNLDWVDEGGVDGTWGMQISYSAATYYAGEYFGYIPKVWSGAITDPEVKYLNFDYKGKGKIYLAFGTYEIINYSAQNGVKYRYLLDADTNDEWKTISIPLSSFTYSHTDESGNTVVDTAAEHLDEVTMVTFMAGETGGLDGSADETKSLPKEDFLQRAKTGSVIFDNMELSDEGDALPPSEIPTRVINFDDYTLATVTTFSGFKNNAGDYSDYVSGDVTASGEGKEGKGYKIEYQSASYFAGEKFTKVPNMWMTDADSNYLEFDVKGHGSVNINLMAGGTVSNGQVLGTRYGQKITVNTDEWKTISIPISKFVTNGEVVPLADVQGISFTAGENGGVDNNATESKEMSKEDLLAKAKHGEIIIDNITLAEESSITDFVADFESADSSFGATQTYDGHKVAADSTYKDYIKGTAVSGEGFGDSTGYKVDYSAAFTYSGEVFAAIPQIWELGIDSAEYLNFDYKGEGVIKLSFSTGNKNGAELTSGTRYTKTLNLDSHGEWAKASIPLSSFVNNGTSVNLNEIGAVTFQAGESLYLDKDSEEAKEKGDDKLAAEAKKGSVIFDNMELSATEGYNTNFADVNVTAEINGQEISKLADGDITVKAAIAGFSGNTDITLAAAIYNADGTLDDVKLAEKTINGEGEVTLMLTVADASGKSMRAFIFDDFEKLHPIASAAQF